MATEKLNLPGMAIAEGANVITGLFNNAFNKTQRTRQNQWSEDMYAQYFSPIAQKHQMKAAGYNPLANENGQSPMAMPSSSSTASSSVSSKLDPMTLLTTKLVKQQIRTQAAEAEGKELENEGLEREIHGYGQMWTLPDGAQTESPRVHELAYNALSRELSAQGLGKDNEAKTIANEIASATKEIQKKITKQTLNKLLEDIRLTKAQVKGKLSENVILKREAELCTKYGISPHDAGWQGLLRILFANDTRIMNGVKNAWNYLTPSFGTSSSSSSKPRTSGGGSW